MQRDQLKQTLNSLHQELAGEPNVDPELQQLLTTLDEDIHNLLEQDSMDEAASPVVDAAEALAARFAVEHPRIEAMVREVVAALAKMGV